MKIEEYNIDIHKHVLASWAASRAASQAKDFKFKVELGSNLLLLGVDASITDDGSFITYIKQITKFDSQDEYDSWHSSTIKNMLTNEGDLKKLLIGNNKKYQHYSYGIAAKILNCYLKVFFIESFGKHKFADFIHPPIDALLLGALKTEDSSIFNYNSPVFENIGVSGTPAWTRINESEYIEIISLIKNYVDIKNQMGLWKIEYAWKGHQ